MNTDTIINGFLIYIYTNIFFEKWHKNILWRRLVLMWGEIVVYCAVAAWVSHRYLDLADMAWELATSACLWAIIGPMLYILLECIGLVLGYLLKQLWSLTHIEQMFIAKDAKNEWVRYLIVLTRS